MSPPTLGAITRTQWIRAGIAAGGGLVAAGGFPPFDVGLLVLVGLAPLLWLWRHSTPAQAAAFGFVWGFAFSTGVMYWIVYFGVVAIIPLMGALAACVALVGALVGLLGRYGVRSAWVTAGAWTIVEVIRGRWPLGGLPWTDVGVGLVDLAPARDLARWGGATVATFLAVLVVGLGVTAVDSYRTDGPRGTRGALVGVAIVVAITVAAALTASVGPATGEVRFAMIQGNDVNRDLTRSEQAERYLPASHFALADSLEGDYDLIVFPESSMDRDPRHDPYLQGEIQRIAAEHDSHVLVNAGVLEPDGNSYNTNFLFAPDGRLVGTYAKQQLVPFGEYIPFEGLIGWIPALEQIPSDYTPGDEMAIFEIGGVPTATVICFENAFADLNRDAVRDGAELVVVSTNNRSYRRSSNPAQHVNLSRMRAVETGRPILHASISGITAIVDADGSVSGTSDLFVNGVTQGTITTRGGQTPYVRYGNWPAVLSVLIVAGAGAVGVSRQRQRSRVVEP